MGLHENFDKITSLTNKKDLTEYVEKRFTTSFIGALSSIEEHLYDLFNEDDWNKYWPPLREEILNKGNAQKRLVLKELEKYQVSKTNQQNQQEERNYNR